MFEVWGYVRRGVYMSESCEGGRRGVGAVRVCVCRSAVLTVLKVAQTDGL